MMRIGQAQGEGQRLAAADAQRGHEAKRGPRHRRQRNEEGDQQPRHHAFAGLL